MIGLVLAAGYATRLYPYTKNKAKALLPVGDRVILDYIVDEMRTIPDMKTIAVISNSRFAADFKQWQKGRDDDQIIILDDQTTSDDNKLGAIGDMQFAIEALDLVEANTDLMVIAGDNLFTYRLKDAWQAFKNWDEDMILGGQLEENEDPRRFALAEVDADGNVLSLVEKPAEPQSDLAVYATYFYKAATVPLVKTYLAAGNPPDSPGHFPAWLQKRKRVKLFQFEGRCIDIGTPDSYRAVQDGLPEIN